MSILLYFTSSTTIKARCFTETLKRTLDLSKSARVAMKNGQDQADLPADDRPGVEDEELQSKILESSSPNWTPV